MQITSNSEEQHLYTAAFIMAIFTIVYNLAEGIIATWFGYEDETLTLFGFGIDSFIEMISGVGILYMVIRIRKNPTSERGAFERTALQITGFAFYFLVVSLIVSAAIIIIYNKRPVTTLWGVVISLISITVMLLLIYGKITVGKKLNSPAIIADANCTKVCIFMSVILLLSSGLYEITHLPYIDAAGTLGLAWFSYREGKECFEKAAGNHDHCNYH